MATSATGVLAPDDLNDTDIAVLDVLRKGRVTPQYAADQMDVSRTYASERLKRLVEHGHVEKVAPGLYELVEDPREGLPPRPYTEESLDHIRTFLEGIETEINRRERGETEGDVEKLRQHKESLEEHLDEITGEMEGADDE